MPGILESKVLFVVAAPLQFSLQFSQTQVQDLCLSWFAILPPHGPFDCAPALPLKPVDGLADWVNVKCKPV